MKATFKPEIAKTITYPAVNGIMFVIGMLIIWLSTHNWLAIIGGLIASLHFQIKIVED